MARRRSSSRGSKYITTLTGKRKRISPGTVLLARLFATGVSATAEARTKPIDASTLARLYLPNTQEAYEVVQRLGPGNQRDNVTRYRLVSPSAIVVAALLGGGLGLDRFFLHQPVLGLAKLLTVGGGGLWWLVDIVTASGRARRHNLQRLLDARGDTAPHAR